MILQTKVSLKKDYGLILDVDSTYTGLLMTHNLLDTHKEGDIVTTRVLDIDSNKNMIDLQEVVSHKRNWNKKDYLKVKVDKYKINGKMLLDGRVVL
jgi:predicted RNA-binding protein with RPS1 domain